ncbi:MAG: hypothetical protein WCI88_15720, partial [Chloroflexota bacterium]
PPAPPEHRPAHHHPMVRPNPQTPRRPIHLARPQLFWLGISSPAGSAGVYARIPLLPSPAPTGRQV